MSTMSSDIFGQPLSIIPFSLASILCLVVALLIFRVAVKSSTGQDHAKSANATTLADYPGLCKLGIAYDAVDQQAKASEEDFDGSKGSQPRILSLWTFPVKSCRGIQLEHGKINAGGLMWDRKFMFVQSSGEIDAGESLHGREQSKWTHITLRDYPKFALVQTEIWLPDESRESGSKLSAVDRGVLVLRWPSTARGTRRSVARALSWSTGIPMGHRVVLPLFPDHNSRESRRVNIWRDSAPAYLFDKEIPSSLALFLGLKKPLIGLARMSSKTVRPVYRNAPSRDIAGYQPEVEFQDSYPLNILGLSSVKAVEARLPPDCQPLSFIRFRANIILTGTQEFAEDTWKTIEISSPDGNSTSQFFITSRTTRCKLPNVDPETGIKHMVEPDKTLRSFRCIDEGAGNTACLAMCMVPKEPGCVVRRGDLVKVLETGEHCYVKATGVRVD